MKKALMAGSAAILTLGLSMGLMAGAPALAQDAVAQACERIEALKASDGPMRLSEEDRALFAAARFEKMSGGADEITREQFLTRAQERAGERAERMFDRLDANNDGVLTAEEFAAQRGKWGGRRGMRMHRHGGDGERAGRAERRERSAEQRAERRAEMRERMLTRMATSFGC